ncbi:unnamed protein product [Pieris macdunnoughi]|uniref:PH domain-containing protein n=1 Tax=Pieris macdunnoughi TaxID=345717 RepID=A0A821NHU5_9NEOP|nr:unnamed protein product [Pieris macdunnoughi]
MMEGSLSKWTNVMKGWQYRWFVLDENAGLLSYYTMLFILHEKVMANSNFDLDRYTESVFKTLANLFVDLSYLEDVV